MFHSNTETGGHWTCRGCCNISPSGVQWESRKYLLIGEEGWGCDTCSGKTSCYCMCDRMCVRGCGRGGLIRWGEKKKKTLRGCVLPNVLSMCVFDLYVQVCVWVSLSAWVLVYVRRHRAICVAFWNQHNPSQIIFHNIPDSWPSRQMASHVTWAAWKHNTILLKAVQIWPAACLVTPALALRPTAQGTVHHLPNSLESIFHCATRDRKWWLLVSFLFWCLFKQSSVFSMANVITQLCKMLIAPKDKTPCVFTDRAQELLFCEPWNQLI